MKAHTNQAFTLRPPPLRLNHTRRRKLVNYPPGVDVGQCKDTDSRLYGGISIRCASSSPEDVGNGGVSRPARRRDVILAPLLVVGASVLRSAVARADETSSSENATLPLKTEGNGTASVTATANETQPPAVVEKEEVINSRIYDATVIGEPMALGKDKRKVWEKLMNARVVYLGEAEQVPTRDDKELEVEILENFRKRCVEVERRISLALEAFPCNLQEQINQYLAKRINGETLKSFVTHWAPQRWQEYEPLLCYCRDNGIQIIACGVPLEVLRTVQAEGVRGLSKTDRKKYAPPSGSGFISGFSSISRRSWIDMNLPYQSSSFGPSSYLSIQARLVEDHTMSQIILQAVADGGSTGMLVVVTGASHVAYGSRGTGVPARISKKMQKKNQVVVLLDPERQNIRREGDVPVADFLWYSVARPCSRNCFDRAEIARVMNAAGRKREALPQDLQKGLDLGLVSPEMLQNFFDLEQYPLIAELTHRFQGFRERLLADPRFLHRLAIEETVSITTTLLAQYERRKENFFEELDYVITDTVRASVVDFFTVWLPAPTISFLPIADVTNAPESTEALQGLLGSIPANAFQKSLAGRDWNLNHRIASVLLGGIKLASVGFISSIGAVTSSNIVYAIRRFVSPTLGSKQRNKRSPILKSALVYSFFLGTSANLRYQVIAGVVEHRISDLFADQTLFVTALSFVARTINCYWGAQQWVDLARYTGLQARKTEESFPTSESSNSAALECSVPEDTNIDDANNQ